MIHRFTAKTWAWDKETERRRQGYCWLQSNNRRSIDNEKSTFTLVCICKDTFGAGLKPELLRRLHVTFRHKEVHHQLVHVLLPDLDIIEFLLPLLLRDNLLRRCLHDGKRRLTQLKQLSPRSAIRSTQSFPNSAGPILVQWTNRQKGTKWGEKHSGRRSLSRGHQDKEIKNFSWQAGEITMVSIRSENWTRASPRTDISASRTGPFETLSKAGRGYVFSPDRTRKRESAAPASRGGERCPE